MTIIGLIIYPIIAGVIGGFSNKKFLLENFIKMFLFVFVVDLIFISLNVILNKYVGNETLENYGVWIFGGFLLLYSIYVSIKGFKNKNKNSNH
ncbi:hypothetical protein [Peribacillus sp. FSL E2-0159]|uniref:hypothetical protein n=1 Tax=Peribacillus sp. FSL E2-0159 TaxID=2975289 RepID=UPI00315A648B